MNLDNLGAELMRVITGAGIAIVSVSVGDPRNKATWTVQPESLQGAAQPLINAFDLTDPSHDSAQLNLEVMGRLDNERLYSAIVWAVIDTYSPPATKGKYDLARAKIIAAYKGTPWK